MEAENGEPPDLQRIASPVIRIISFSGFLGNNTMKVPLPSLMAELSMIILLLYQLDTLFILRTSCKSENEQQKNPNKTKPTKKLYGKQY